MMVTAEQAQAVYIVSRTASLSVNLVVARARALAPPAVDRPRSLHIRDLGWSLGLTSLGYPLV
jgi:hypothetical protein